MDYFPVRVYAYRNEFKIICLRTHIAPSVKLLSQHVSLEIQHNLQLNLLRNNIICNDIYILNLTKSQTDTRK